MNRADKRLIAFSRAMRAHTKYCPRCEQHTLLNAKGNCAWCDFPLGSATTRVREADALKGES